MCQVRPRVRANRLRTALPTVVHTVHLIVPIPRHWWDRRSAVRLDLMMTPELTPWTSGVRADASRESARSRNFRRTPYACRESGMRYQHSSVRRDSCSVSLMPRHEPHTDAVLDPRRAAFRAWTCWNCTPPAHYRRAAVDRLASAAHLKCTRLQGGDLNGGWICPAHLGQQAVSRQWCRTRSGPCSRPRDAASRPAGRSRRARRSSVYTVWMLAAAGEAASAVTLASWNHHGCALAAFLLRRIERLELALLVQSRER